MDSLCPVDLYFCLEVLLFCRESDACFPLATELFWASSLAYWLRC